MDESFIHLRHKAPRELARPRTLVLALPQLRSNINLARIVRVAGCCGVPRIIACGKTKIDPKVARDALQQVTLERPRSLEPALRALRSEGYELVGLEQTSGSKNLHHFSFPRQTALVIGHERLGITQDILDLLHHVIEIPVWGAPHSYNVATATTMALYEYCRQYPDG